MSLEKAVQKLTAEPADIFGMKDRGRLKVGSVADIVVFDPGTVNSPTRGTMVYDLPAGGRRLIQKAQGYRHVFVSGVETVADDVFTGALPGKLVRGGAAPVSTDTSACPQALQAIKG